jgi:hypothetical protein
MAIPMYGVAQSDSTQYIYGLPVTPSDTATAAPEADPDTPKKRVWVNPEQLPKRLKRELDTKNLYKGWRNDSVFLDLNTRLYLIRIREKNSMRIYGFDQDGNPVTYDEVSLDK